MTREQFSKLKTLLNDDEKELLNRYIRWFYDSDRYLFYDFYEDIGTFAKQTFKQKYEEAVK